MTGPESGGASRWQHLRVSAAGPVVRVTLSNPPVNALTTEMFEGVSQTLDLLEADAVRVLIVTGEGANFSIGADVRGIPEVTREHLRRSQRLLDRIARFPKPCIAAINGHCLGGGLELALACHLRIASSRARLALPEVSLGLIPGMGGTYRLPRLVGSTRAHELILTGRTMKADEALEMGLVSAVVPPAEVLPEAERLARRIAAKSPSAVRAALECLNHGVDTASAALVEMECFERLAQQPEVRRTLHALGAALGERREDV
jgi:enoyl-CoA hydratase/carnithine racemase